MPNFLKNKKIFLWLKEEIGLLCRDLPQIKIMHVCGTHEYTISRYGLRCLLPVNLQVISGPGCPVCCTPAADIDFLIELSLKDKVVVSCFGDMLRVPGSKLSLAQAKAAGGKVKIVYSILGALEFARKNKNLEVVHSAIGFETTAPTTAAVILNDLPDNFSILSSHRLIPPAMEFLLRRGENRIDGFIAPGHVSVIIGGNAYKKISQEYQRPIVISGFEPADVLYGIYLILCQIKKNEAHVEIEYQRAVDWLPQREALRLMNKAFDSEKSFWRGIGAIAESGLVLKKRLKHLDALERFQLKRTSGKKEFSKNCRCAGVLQGRITPQQCPLFGRSCSPGSPRGPCMVSSEGSCAIFYAHRGKQKF